MPDILGHYSLKETSGKVGVSVSWVNKVQRRTGIPRPLAKKGSSVSFDTVDIQELKAVRFLRLLEYGFDEIKQVYMLENSIVEFERENSASFFPRQKRPPDTPDALNCLLYVPREYGRMKEFYHPIIYPVKIHEEKLGKVKFKKYKEMVDRLLMTHAEIRQRANELNEFLSKNWHILGPVDYFKSFLK